MTWIAAAPAISAAFLSSLVEAVEALTIVLAVASVRGWRPAGLGAAAGLALLVVIVLALGPLLDRVPLYLLQLTIGILLLLFGMRWLRKAILRAAGVIPLHDETTAFAAETAELREQARRHEARLDWLAGLASFNCDRCRARHARSREHRCRGGLRPRRGGRLRHAPPARAGAGEHAQIRRRYPALGVRSVLDRRRPRRAVAG